MQIAAQNYTPTDATQIPTGKIIPVKGMRYDYTTPTSATLNDPEGLGVDMKLVLDANRTGPAASVTAQSGLEMKIWTDEPGLQVFNAPSMDIPVAGLDGQKYGSFSGLCLETQHYPDSLNQPNWPSIIHTPAQPYYQN